MSRVKYIKCRVEFILPVPAEIDDDLDAVAEAGLSTLRALIVDNVTTMIAGTIHTSWQSMPQSWQPPRSARDIVLAEEIAPGFVHQVDTEERVSFVDTRFEDNVQHPWDQGLYVFPEGHPARLVEEKYRSHYLDPQFDNDKTNLIDEFLGDVRAIGSGEEDDDSVG
jgi:hypothetical protein